MYGQRHPSRNVTLNVCQDEQRHIPLVCLTVKKGESVQINAEGRERGEGFGPGKVRGPSSETHSRFLN